MGDLEGYYSCDVGIDGIWGSEFFLYKDRILLEFD